MIVKVEIIGLTAQITSSPKDRPRLVMTYPASRVRMRFAEKEGPLVGYFLATEAVTKDVATGVEYALDVIELGDRLIAPKEVW